MGNDAMAPVRIVRQREDRREAIAALIARAFQDDPLCVAACPDPLERARWLRWSLRMGVWMGFRFGQILGTGGQLDGVAVMVGPGRGRLTKADIADLDYHRGRERVGAELWDRSRSAILTMLAPVEEAFDRAVTGSHWYLDVIAVEPGRQGRGIGSALLHAVHARTDADAVPTVLLTFQQKNLTLYQRHGYVVVSTGIVPDEDLPWWGMRRDPGA